MRGAVKYDNYTHCLTINAKAVQPVSAHEIAQVPKLTLQPVYRLSRGIDAEDLRHRIQVALAQTPLPDDPLPAKVKRRYGLVDLKIALKQIHFPETETELEAARQRLVFDEFFYLHLALLLHRGRTPVAPGRPLKLELLGQFQANLPFTLTQAQQRVIVDILDDLAQPFPMNRLVQGDVGSGKTVVAVAACLAVIAQGHQAALMAPTETLAEQHYHKVKGWLKPLGMTTALLMGATRAKARRALLADLASGQIDLVVGTHALVSANVTYANLGLAVIDEQHRFGVKQRNALVAKGPNPHLLSMTATPIPRTLALALHQDVDVSLIDELPPGRKAIITQVLGPEGQGQVQRLVKLQLAMGFQAYVVLPLVERSTDGEVKSAQEAYAQYQQAFADYQVGLLHGRMTTQAKSKALNAFRAGQSQILVSTTVIEVGVDVPKATVMVVEQAERFGLAQLHQLRGRVGRSGDQSYCLLIDGAGTAASQERLSILAQHQDGFKIAEADLQMRGAGEVLGQKQTGIPQFALADLVKDRDLLPLAHSAARGAVAKGERLQCWPRLLAEAQRRGHLERALHQPHLN